MVAEVKIAQSPTFLLYSLEVFLLKWQLKSIILIGSFCRSFVASVSFQFVDCDRNTTLKVFLVGWHSSRKC
jgi:hypothetical protein